MSAYRAPAQILVTLSAGKWYVDLWLANCRFSSQPFRAKPAADAARDFAAALIRAWGLPVVFERTYGGECAGQPSPGAEPVSEQAVSEQAVADFSGKVRALAHAMAMPAREPGDDDFQPDPHDDPEAA